MVKALREVLSINGHLSSMRVMCFFALIVGAALAFYGLRRGVNPAELTLLVSVFVGGAFGGKVMQRKSENPKD